MLGTAKERQRTKRPTDAHELEDVVLKDHRGRDVRLGDLWSTNPAVLVFLRHYG